MGLHPRQEERGRRLAAAATRERIVRVERLGSLSNTLLRARGDAGADVVVRLMRRRSCRTSIEAAVMRTAGTVVPAPEVLLVDAAGAVAGNPSLVLEFVRGQRAVYVMRTADEATRRQIGHAVGAAAGRLTTIAFGSAGRFCDDALTVSPPASADFLEAYVAISSAEGDTLVEPRFHRSWELVCRDHPEVLSFVASGASLVHGDLNLSNVLVEPSDIGWRITGIVDWEFAFSGSPIFDLTSILRGRSDDTVFTSAVAEGFSEQGRPLPDSWLTAARVLDDLQMWEFLRPIRSVVGASSARILLRILKPHL